MALESSGGLYRVLEDSGGLWSGFGGLQRTPKVSGYLWMTLEGCEGLFRAVDRFEGLLRVLKGSGGL